MWMNPTGLDLTKDLVMVLVVSIVVSTIAILIIYPIEGIDDEIKKEDEE